MVVTKRGRREVLGRGAVGGVVEWFLELSKVQCSFPLWVQEDGLCDPAWASVKYSACHSAAQLAPPPQLPPVRLSHSFPRPVPAFLLLHCPAHNHERPTHQRDAPAPGTSQFPPSEFTSMHSTNCCAGVLDRKSRIDLQQHPPLGWSLHKRPPPREIWIPRMVAWVGWRSLDERYAPRVHPLQVAIIDEHFGKANQRSMGELQEGTEGAEIPRSIGGDT